MFNDRLQKVIIFLKYIVLSTALVSVLLEQGSPCLFADNTDLTRIGLVN